jgi:hypothetical protein
MLNCTIFSLIKNKRDFMKDSCEKFESVEQAWFWFCRCSSYREFGARGIGDCEAKKRLCEINDIYRIIKMLRFQSVLSNRHLRVMKKWGDKQICPHRSYGSKRSEEVLWAYSMRALECVLISKGLL